MIVTHTEGMQCRTMLDNILCGIMYRFRVRAFNEVGSSIPGIASDAFVIDTPGVHIAPYFILCPPAETTRYIHQTAQFRAKALGTPKPNILWQKDDEPIFITEGIDIMDEPDGSLLTVHNLHPEDEGVIQCIAVNQVGKAIASTNLSIVALPKFKRTSTAPLQFTFRADEMIRLKFPFVSNPPAEFQLMKGGRMLKSESVDVSVIEDDVLFRIESATMENSGHYTIVADNGHGEDRIEFDLDIEVPPESPGCPEVLEVSPQGQLTLLWAAPKSSPVDHYIIEYYRDQWQLWLRLKTTIDTQTVVTDLIPGSKYKFRVMSASLAGISDPSEASEEVMIGTVADDELFDLPSYSRGRSSSRMGRRLNKMPSVDRGMSKVTSGAINRRQTSLDREVYYDSDNVRKEVVTYKPVESQKIGGLSDKYKLSNEDLDKYKSSMSQLCNKMKAISNNSLIAGRQTSGDPATNPLRREVLSQCRQYRSGHLRSSSSLAERPGSQMSGDVSECKKSLNDIRDRIGSLQSLLAQSRSLTSSRQQLLSDIPPQVTGGTSAPGDKAAPSHPPLITSQADAAKKEHFATHRNDSYSKAMDGDSDQIQVLHYMNVFQNVRTKICLNLQETHFPYNSQLSELLCDKPENRQSHSPVVKDKVIANGVASPAPRPPPRVSKQPLDIRALSPQDAMASIPLSPEPDSSMSTATLLASEATEGTLVADTDRTDLISDADRTLSCSTLDGEEDLPSESESLL